jgi:hypothetical protein
MRIKLECQKESSVFESFAAFERVIVTGPHRSGTRICAKMIAYDTGFEFVDENDIGLDSSLQLWSLFDNNRHFVVQCPALCRYVHLFGIDDTAIVLMRRNVKDIIASQERIGWRWEWLELARYDRLDGAIAEVKYEFWGKNQRAQIKHAFEVEYESLSRHPLWVPQPLRRDFGAEQTICRNEELALNPNALPCPRSDTLYWAASDNGEAIIIKTRQPAKLLNATGRLIWSLCDGTRTRQDILQVLKAQFDGVEESTLARDLDEFIDELVAGGFLWLSSSAIPRTPQMLC